MHNKFKRQLELLCSINELVELISTGEKLADVVFEDLENAFISFGLTKENRMVEITSTLAQNLDSFQEFIEYFNRWYDAQILAIANSTKLSDTYKTLRLGCDREFNSFVKLIKKNKLNELKSLVMDNLEKVRRDNPDLYQLLTVGYRGWYFENNWLDGIGGKNNSLIHNRMTTLKHNIEKIEWLYDNLEDNDSRMTLNALIDNWLPFSMAKPLANSVYTAEVANVKVLPFYENEVFVDCGSFTGDTVLQYTKEVDNKYKHIYTYDISRPTVNEMKQNLVSFKNITYNLKGVSDKAGELTLAGLDQPFQGNKLTDSENHPMAVEKVAVVTIDEDIDEAITFLKVDVEGMDKEALNGARQQIIKYHPKIHVDAYHKLADFFEIPMLIKSIDSTYRFYLRIGNTIEKPIMFPFCYISAI